MIKKLIYKIIGFLTKPRTLFLEENRFVTKGFCWTTIHQQDRIGNWFVIDRIDEYKQNE